MPHRLYTPIREKTPFALCSLPFVFAAYFFSYPIFNTRQIIAALFACALVYGFLSFLLPKRIVYTPKSDLKGKKCQPDQGAKARSLLLQISLARTDIKNTRVKKSVTDIEVCCQSILSRLACDPDKGQKIMPFVTYCLSAAARLTCEYAQTESQNSAELVQMLDSIELALDSLAKALKKQLDSLLKGNIAHITDEIQVLERMLSFYSL